MDKKSGFLIANLCSTTNRQPEIKSSKPEPKNMHSFGDNLTAIENI